MTTELASVQTALSVARSNTLSTQVIRSAGAGRAYQSVAQSAAMAIQDGTMYLRNMTTISSTTAGIAITKILAGDDKMGLELLTISANLVPTAAQNYVLIGQSAAAVLNGFPSS